MRAEGKGGRQKSEAKSQEAKGKTRKEERWRKGEGGGTKSAAISAPNMPAGHLEDVGFLQSSVSRLKWPKEVRLGVAKEAQIDAPGVAGGTVPGTVPGVVGGGSPEPVFTAVAGLISGANWTATFRPSCGWKGRPIARPIPTGSCGLSSEGTSGAIG